MVLIVFGLPGTGKSYFARHLARETGTSYLNTDIIRQELGRQGRYDRETSRYIYELLMERMADLLSEKQDIILDGTFKKSARK